MLILQGSNSFLEVLGIRHHPLRESFSCLVSHCFTSLYSSLWDLQIDRILHTFIISLRNLVLFGDTNFDIQSTTIQESLLIFIFFFADFYNKIYDLKLFANFDQFSIFLNFFDNFVLHHDFQNKNYFHQNIFFHST